MGDIWIALTVFPWLIPLALFTVTFVEMSSRAKGESSLHTRLFGDWHAHEEAIRRSVDWKEEK